MECPVCYNEYDTMNFKPKLGECGHTICQHCITRLKKCCLCNTPFPADRSQHRRPDYFVQPWPATLDPLASKSHFKDNYALLDMLEKQCKDYDVCRTSKMFEEFFCVECKVTVCNVCIDQEHSDHIFRRISPKMYSINRSLQMKVDETDAKITQSMNIKEKLEHAELKNRELKEIAPKIIDSLCDRMVVMIYNSRDYVKACLETELSEKSSLIELVNKSIKEMTESLTKMKDQMSELSTDITKEHFLKNSIHIEKFDQLEACLIPLHKEVTIKNAEHIVEDYKAVSMHDKLEKVVIELGKVLPGYKKNSPTNPFDSAPRVQLFPDESGEGDRMYDNSITIRSGSRHVFRRQLEDEDYRTENRVNRFRYIQALDDIIQGRDVDFYRYLGRQRRSRMELNNTIDHNRSGSEGHFRRGSEVTLRRGSDGTISRESSRQRSEDPEASGSRSLASDLQDPALRLRQRYHVAPVMVESEDNSVEDIEESEGTGSAHSRDTDRHRDANLSMVSENSGNYY